MRAWVPGYDMATPATLAEALETLAAAPEDWTPFAGGTDLMVLFEQGRLPHGRYLSLWQLGDELRGIDVSDTHVTLGALTTYADVREHPVLNAEFPMLCAAARESGAIAIQNRGTIGGNIVNASPAADTPPALLAYDAEIALASTRGTRWRGYDGFHTGYKQMDRGADELLVSIRVPRRADPRAWRHRYHKVGTRKFQAISKVCFAGVARLDDGRVQDVRIGLGSVGPTVLRASATELALNGRATIDQTLEARAAEAMRTDVTPIDDIRSTATYRRNVSANLGAAFVRALRSG